MRILVACEESQAVTKELRALGHEAYSCDIEPCSGGHPEWHIQGDAIKAAYNELQRLTLESGGCVFYTLNDWDMIIAHPPCTYLTNSGVTWLYNKDGTKNEARWNKLDESAEFFKSFLNHPCKKIAIENPIPHKYATERIGKKYSQIIQPWMFGHKERKATCFWLKGLPELHETKNVKEEMLKLPKNEQQRLHYLPPSKDRAKLRSKTFPGIAKAMATQWTNQKEVTQ